MSYNLSEHLTVQQKQAIIRIITKQEKKKAEKNNPDIYQNYIDEPEFWNGLAKKIADSLFESSSNYYEGYKIESRGNLDGKGYRIELLDEKNEEKFFIDYTSEVGEAERYTVPSFWDSIDGLTIFFLIMIPVYLIAFIISFHFIDDTMTPFFVTIGLGIVNLWLLFNF